MGQAKTGRWSILEEVIRTPSRHAPLPHWSWQGYASQSTPATQGGDVTVEPARGLSAGDDAAVAWQVGSRTSMHASSADRVDGASLVHELLRPGLPARELSTRTDFQASELSTCRCPACSRLFVTSATAATEAAAVVASLDLGLTFKLHSNPNANHRIYLDFDGYVLANSQWENGGALSVGAFYGANGVFSDAALRAIQEIWRRVAEDFAPFNIDVTTEQPTSADLQNSGAGDTRWGIRVAMTTNINLLTNRPITNAGGGGTAYLGSFNWATDEVCLVFNGYNATDAASIYAAAETVSHEVGHTLGLSHDGGTYGSNASYYEGHGTGATSWGTIMGAPFINADENVTTWSKGDYIGANNRQDDLGIITGSVSNAYVSGNGFSYRVDDYGDNLATAYRLSGTTPSSFGIIERNTDVDWFCFSTGSGDISLSIRNACQVFSANGDGTFSTHYLDGLGPNLDISANLYSSTGVLIASSNPLAQLDASFNLFLAAGDYYLSVEGVGFGNPLANPPSGYTDYGSLGQYLISGTLVSTIPVPALILTPSAGLTTSEAGAQSSFSVVLGTAPAADVVVNVVSSNEGEGTVSTPSLTFTPENWNTAQTVTVTGADDPLFDGPLTYSVTLTSSSADPAYQALTSSASLTNLDNDFPVLSFVGAPQTVVEGQSASVTYQVSLSSASLVPVTVAFATSNGTAIAGSDYTATSGILSFAPGQTSQSITITLLNDSLNEADETFSLILSSPTNAVLGSVSSITTTITDTLVASTSTVLPLGIENLRLDGLINIDATGNTAANVITGNSANNVLRGGGGIDTLSGLAGLDSFDLTGISSAANRSTIIDFDPITSGGETIRLSNNLTSRNAPALSLAIVASRATRVTLNTTAADLFAFNFDNTEDDVNLANSTNGAALLDGLNAANGSAALNTSARGGAGYIVAYDNGNAYLYRFNAGANSAVAANEIALIGILDSSTAIGVGALNANHFVLV